MELIDTVDDCSMRPGCGCWRWWPSRVGSAAPWRRWTTPSRRSATTWHACLPRPGARHRVPGRRRRIDAVTPDRTPTPPPIAAFLVAVQQAVQTS